MAYADLQGALVSLKLVTTTNLAKLHSRMQEPASYREAECAKPPDMERLKKRLFHDKSFVAWEMWPTTGGGCVGYVGLVMYAGPPFIYVDFFGKLDIDLARDSMLAVLPAFFHNTEEERLCVHVIAELADQVHGAIVEAGFDPIELTGFDATKCKSYALARDTYQIYYENAGGEHGDEGAEDEVGDEA